MMSVDDYLIDHAGFDWANLLSGWSRLLPAEFTVWLMNRFGDLFLVMPEGAVHMLDIGAGTLSRLTDDRDDFCRRIDADGNANNWLMIPLVDQLAAAGIHPGPGQCYSFVTPPILGGNYTTENTAIVPIREHYEVYGMYHDRLRDLPDGSKVIINVVD